MGMHHGSTSPLMMPRRDKIRNGTKWKLIKNSSIQSIFPSNDVLLFKNTTTGYQHLLFLQFA